MKRVILYAAIASLTLSLASCIKGENHGTKPSIENLDFSTTTDISLKLNYAIPRQVQFEIYAECPVEIDAYEGESAIGERKDGVKALFRAFTNSDGRFEDLVNIPSYLESFYVYSDNYGVPALIKVSGITGNKVAVECSAAVAAAASRADGMTNKHNAFWSLRDPADQWDVQTGRPDYLLAGRADLPEDFLWRLHAYFGEGLDQRGTDFYDNASQNIALTKDTKVTMSFIHAACYSNALGYYTYRTADGAPQSMDQIKAIIAFPLPRYGGLNPGLIGGHDGDMVMGDQIELKYWNGTEMVEQFPAGTSIGLIVVHGGFSRTLSSVTLTQRHYSTQTELTKNYFGGNDRQAITVYSPQDDMVAVAFEDKDYYEGDRGSKFTYDFNELMVGLKTSVPNAVDTSSINELPTSEFDVDKHNIIDYEGTLAFEDLWPDHGDYDLNDVVVRYHCTHYRDRNNLTVKVIDRFYPVHSGATLWNGFGYQYYLSADEVHSLDFTTDYPGGKPSTFDFTAKGFEQGQRRKATVMVFDDINKAVRKPDPYCFTITMVPESPMPQWQVTLPPYNPFIVVRFSETDRFRGREVHLTSHAPTELADPSLFKQGYDLTDPEKVTTCYTSRPVADLSKPMPFALHFKHEFVWPGEGVPIYQTYPRFLKWVEAGTYSYKDWYLHPAQ